MLEDELEGEIGEEESVTSYLQASAMPAQPTGTPGGKVPVAAGKVDEYGLPVETQRKGLCSTIDVIFSVMGSNVGLNFNKFTSL